MATKSILLCVVKNNLQVDFLEQRYITFVTESLIHEFFGIVTDLHSMLDYLKTYLEINQIEPTQKILEAGKILEKEQKKSLVNLAKKGYILAFFQKLCQGKLTLEEFMQIGDEGSEQMIYPVPLIDDPETYLATALALDDPRLENSLVVVDRPVSSSVEKKLQAKGSILLVI